MLYGVRKDYENAVELAQEIANEFRKDIVIRKSVFGRPGVYGEHDRVQVEYQICEPIDLLNIHSPVYCQTIHREHQKSKLMNKNFNS